MGQLGRSNPFGSGVGTSELETPNRALDHFAVGYTSPTRALGTTYTNTGATARLVIIVGAVGGGGNIICKVGPGTADPPTLAVARTFATAATTMTFIVPPGLTYRADHASGALTSWEEVQL